MGGQGSTRWGRRRFPPRARIDEVHRLESREAVRSLRCGRRTCVGEIRWSPQPIRSRSLYLVRKGVLTPHRSLRPRRYEYTVYLVFWPLPFAGERSRAWLVCCGCSKRRKALFLVRGHAFRCRVCERLAYALECLTPRKRAALRRDRVARRVSRYWDTNERPPERPRGMHRRRYVRELTVWHQENQRAAARAT